MAKMETPAHIEIASLREKQVHDVDLMAPGPGTPWENRGSLGTVGSFFKTAGAMMFKPSQTYAMLSRPNATGDGKSFVFICSFFWSLAVITHAIVMVIRSPEPIDPTGDLMGHFIFVIAAPFIFIGLLAIARNIFSTLVESELKKGTPKSLAANVFAYAAAPSIIAPLVVPLNWAIGVAVVWLWIALIATAGARSRMRLSFGGGLIAVFLGVFVVGVIIAGGWFGLIWVLGSLLTMGNA